MGNRTLFINKLLTYMTFGQFTSVTVYVVEQKMNETECTSPIIGVWMVFYPPFLLLLPVVLLLLLYSTVNDRKVTHGQLNNYSGVI